jgi:GT2 family glycosyltransferase
MLIRRAVFDSIGLFDPDYFFGFEDVDFCLRARGAGLLTVATGAAIAEHEGQASIGRRSARRISFATRNHLLLASRRFQRRSTGARWFQTVAILGWNLAHVLFSSDVPLRQGWRGFLNGAHDYFSDTP